MCGRQDGGACSCRNEKWYDGNAADQSQDVIAQAHRLVQDAQSLREETRQFRIA